VSFLRATYYLFIGWIESRTKTKTLLSNADWQMLNQSRDRIRAMDRCSGSRDLASQDDFKDPAPCPTILPGNLETFPAGPGTRSSRSAWSFIGAPDFAKLVPRITVRSATPSNHSRSAPTLGTTRLSAVLQKIRSRALS